MTLVVSDTSPLTNLAAIGQFGLLQKLYGSLLIAEAVWGELNAEGQHWPGSRRYLDSSAYAEESVARHGTPPRPRFRRSGKHRAGFGTKG